ncbi:MAG: ABC transporter ATP-binding protein [Flavobacteriales bacterium]|nr:ABC transporter ATP-binding protein [Flavobacteriales bacterium]MCB9198295.1 ABC transporter ATP-binding protein [Flavobacteriales bacterium]
MKNIKVSSSPLGRLWCLLKPDRSEIINVYVYAIFNGLVYLTLPLGIQAIINLIQVGSVNTSLVMLISIVIFGVAINGILQIFQLKITENLQQKIFARAAFDFAYRIPRIRMEKIYKEYAPELMNRFFDIVSVQKGLSKILIDFSTASVQLLVGLVILSLYHPFFIALSLVLIFFLYAVFRYTSKKGLVTSLKESKYKYKIAYWLQEVARANVTFKLAGNSTLPLDKTDQYVNRYIDAREKHFKVLVTQYSLMVVVKVIVALGLLVIGGMLVLERQMNIGQFVASEILVLLIMGAVEKLIASLEVVYDVLTSLEKIGQVTDLELEDSNSCQLFPENVVNGVSVDFVDVNYKFPDDDQKVLKDVSFRAESGEKVLIYATEDLSSRAVLYLASILTKQYSGSIAFNDIPRENIDMELLRSMTGDNLRKDMIFHGTVLENITMNRPQVSHDDVMRVAEITGLISEIKKYEKGFEKILNPDALDYSESFIQQIILSRALVGSPKLLVLNDEFMKIQKDNGKEMLQKIFQSFTSTTILFASNNKNYFSLVDKVIVFDKGSVKTQGSPDQIINKLK